MKDANEAFLYVLYHSKLIDFAYEAILRENGPDEARDHEGILTHLTAVPQQKTWLGPMYRRTDQS